MASAEKTQSHKLLILDGHSLAFRAFYALPEDLQTSDGTRTNAVFGFTSMLIKLLQEQNPDYIACCFDLGLLLERTERFAGYKANRTAAPETFSSQVPLIREVLRVMRIPVYELAGHEADDIISFLAKRAASEGVDVRIVTGDRDFFQLVGKNIKVLYNRRGITDIIEMDARAVEERYGIPPSKYVDLKALEGDPSDNLPGVPGVGTKTAAKLILKYGSAEEVVAHASEQTPKLAQSLAAHAEQVSINKQLSTLIEVPLNDVALDDLKMGMWDLNEIRELFTSFEFKSLLERLVTELPDSARVGGKPFELRARAIHTESDLEALAQELRVSGGFAIDLVSALPGSPPRSLAFSWGAGEVAFVPVGRPGLTEVQIANVLGPLLADSSLPKVVHGGRVLVLGLSAIGVELAGLKLDTLVGAYLLDPGAAGYDLADVALKYSGRELKAAGAASGDSSAQGTLDTTDLSENSETEDGGDSSAQGTLAFDVADQQPNHAAEHNGDDSGGPGTLASKPGEEPGPSETENACLRALAVAETAPKVERELERLGMANLYRTIEQPLIPVLARMERVGVKIDLDYLSGMARDIDQRLTKLEADCYELAGERLNLGSPTQLRVLLYERLGLKTRRRTKTGMSTDARALQQLVDQHPFVAKLLEHRELAKLKNTYIDALPPLVDPREGRLHTTYDQTVAATGRLSSVNPNLMNIPIRTELGKQIRRAFIPEPAHLFLSADYSQIELRIMAHLSEDPTLLEIFRKNEDVHSATASRVFRVDPKELSVKHRSVAKMVNYGLAYGMGAPGLAERLNVPFAEAKEIMDAYFEQFRGVREFLDAIVTQAKADGFTTTMFGRRRYLPELGSGNPRVRAIGERQALNAPIQGTAADIMKLALINVDRALRDQGLGTRIILTVHDELVLEVPEHEREVAARIIEREMTGAADLRVPLVVDVSFGSNWAEAKG
jgi:DNA polymerase-1